MIKLTTAVRLFDVACSRLLGGYGTIGVYYAGRLMANIVKWDTTKDETAYYEAGRYLEALKKEFRMARHNNGIHFRNKGPALAVVGEGGKTIQDL